MGPCGICTSRREIRRSSFGHEGNDGNQADSRVQRGDRDEEVGAYHHRTQDFRQEVQVRRALEKDHAQVRWKKTAKKAKDDELVKDEDTQVDDELDDDAEVNDDDLDVDDLDENLDDVDEDDADDEDLDEDDADDDDVEDDEDEEEAKSKAPEQPKEKGAYVVSDTDDEEENIIPSGNPKRRCASRPAQPPTRSRTTEADRPVSLLNAEQEVDLSERIEAGLYAQHLLDTESEGMEFKRKRELKWAAADGKKAKDHLLEANLRLVVSLAKRYTGRGMLFLDLIQERQPWSHSCRPEVRLKKGFKFSTYATWWIVRPSPVPWPIRPAPFACLCTWSK